MIQKSHIPHATGASSFFAACTKVKPLFRQVLGSVRYKVSSQTPPESSIGDGDSRGESVERMMGLVGKESKYKSRTTLLRPQGMLGRSLLEVSTDARCNGKVQACPNSRGDNCLCPYWVFTKSDR